jgi:hypothetical protein
MRRVSSFALFVLSFFVAGCAIHPLPEDVTGVDTYHIVRQIRCEARETIRLEVIKWLRKMADAGDPFAESLAVRYASDPDSISEFRPEIFKGPSYDKVRSVAKLFYDAGIAYGFELTMTENDDVTAAGLTFIRPVLRPVLNLGLSGSATRKRSNLRTFTVTDTFSYLLTQLNTDVRGHRYCDGQIVQENYIYPIAGRIGIDRMINDFVELTLFASLSEKGAKPGAKGAPTMSDQLTFTTGLTGSANPSVLFTPVGSAFQLTNAGLTLGAGRMDMHQVTVALAISTGDVAELAAVQSFLFSSARGATPTPGRLNTPTILVGNRITGTGRTTSELLAMIAVDKLKSRELQLLPSP